MLSDREKELVRRLAAQDDTVRSECKAIYSRHFREFVHTGRKSVEMNFLLEVFTKTPDLVLRSAYRRQILGKG